MMLGLFISEHERKNIRGHAIRVLETLIQEDHVGRTRSTDLLSNFAMECAVGWFMCVPRWFKEALDIRNTGRIIANDSLEIPTQGSRFNFKRGYMLYRAQFFSQDESEKLSKGIAGIQIKNAVPAMPPDRNKKIGRDHGYVEFDSFLSSNGKISFSEPIRRVSSQDEFVKMLIMGAEIS